MFAFLIKLPASNAILFMLESFKVEQTMRMKWINKWCVSMVVLSSPLLCLLCSFKDEGKKCQENMKSKLFLKMKKEQKLWKIIIRCEWEKVCHFGKRNFFLGDLTKGSEKFIFNIHFGFTAVNVYLEGRGLDI